MDVNDDALGLVLERVGHVSLVRAAAVCRRWRRVIADAAFLRRFRFLHAPAVVGHYRSASTWAHSLRKAKTTGRDGPVFLPLSPPVVHARHFSLDFLPNGARSWIVDDSRGSLLLMGPPTPCQGFRDSLVCEPLTRRYMMVPSPSNFDGNCQFLAFYLIDGDTDKAGGCIGMSNFRVLCMLCHGYTFKAALFAKDGESGSTSWSEKSIDCIAPGSKLMSPFGRAGGSWYFYTKCGTWIVLDGSTGEFSRSQLPVTENGNFDMWKRNFCITEGRDSKPRILTVFDNNMEVFMRLDSGDWVLEKRVLLSEATSSLPGYQPSFFSHPLYIMTQGVGFIIVSPWFKELWPFSVDLDTMEVSPAAAGDMEVMLYRCELPWPPALHALQWYIHMLQ